MSLTKFVMQPTIHGPHSFLVCVFIHYSTKGSEHFSIVTSNVLMSQVFLLENKIFTIF
jgi:hypothetical protein